MRGNLRGHVKQSLEGSLTIFVMLVLFATGPSLCDAEEVSTWPSLANSGGTWQTLETEGWVEGSYTDPIDELGSIPNHDIAMPPSVETWVADNGGSDNTSAELNSGAEATQVSHDGGAEGVPGLHHSGSAAPAPAAGDDARLGLTFTSAYSSKWMWRGYNIFDNPMYANVLKAKLWDTGFNLTIANIGTASDRSDSILPDNAPSWITEALPNFQHKDFDANLYRADWAGSICDQIDVSLGAQYYDFYGISSSRLDYMEAFSVFTLSKLPLSPHVGFYYGWPYGSAREGEGWMVDYGVSHFHPFQDLSFCNFKLVGLLLKADLWYNGGAWAPRQAPGWSHATFTGAMPIALSEKLSLTPMLNYQYSIEDDVDPDNEWYTAVALQYKW